MTLALTITIILVVIGAWSIGSQVRQLRSMSGRVMASDERHYLRRRAYRRIVTGMLLFGLAGMLAGAFLSGMTDQFTELSQRERQPDQEFTEEEKRFVRIYALYWCGILVLVFLVFSAAIIDFWATRRYGLGQLRQLRQDHREKLARDLALYRQRINDRMRTRPGSEED